MCVHLFLETMHANRMPKASQIVSKVNACRSLASRPQRSRVGPEGSWRLHHRSNL